MEIRKVRRARKKIQLLINKGKVGVEALPGLIKKVVRKMKLYPDSFS